jgi:RimJ/RimL family protein N-acetyltransferase
MLSFRKPSFDDNELYFEWANDPEVREQSYNSKLIKLEDHTKWFESALLDESCYMYIFQNSAKDDIGQVRIKKQNNKESIIGISIAYCHRGKGYAKEMLTAASNSFLELNKEFLINAYIKYTNLSSKYAFETAGFDFIDMVEYENVRSFHFIKR